MGMPQIPDGKNRPSFNETIIDLLESIALEEMAISHILNAQGEKTQEIIKRFSCKDISYDELLCGCRVTQEMIHSLIMKEWLLTTKLNTVTKIGNITNYNTSESKDNKYKCPNFICVEECNEVNKNIPTICEKCAHKDKCARNS